MPTYNKLVTDVAYSISWCLVVLEGRYRNLLSLLFSKPYREDVEEELREVIYKFYRTDSGMSHYFRDIFTYELKEEYKEAVNKMADNLKKTLDQAEKIARDSEKQSGRFRVLKHRWIFIYPNDRRVEEKRR